LSKVVLVGYSEGCQAIRAHLLAGAQPWGVVAVDGTHSEMPEANRKYSIIPYRQAFDRARLNPDRALFVATHSGLTYVETLPKPYASTHTTLERITGQQLPLPDPSDEPVVFKAGEAYVLSSGIVGETEAFKYHSGGDRWRASHIKQARFILPKCLKDYVAPRLTSGWSVEEPTTAHEAGGKSLGERCVQWCLQHLGHTEDPPGSNDSDLIRSWLAPCERGYGSESVKLYLKRANWCAAFQCAAMRACVVEGDKFPHGYRAGVVEMVEDTTPGSRGEGVYTGHWRPVSLARDGGWQPKAGDLAVWDRSVAGKEHTSWWRHVERVVDYRADTRVFTAIGGNEAHTVRIDQSPITAARLLGFIEYPAPTPVRARPQEGITDADRQQIRAWRDAFWLEYLDSYDGFHG
jgi:hypothetical protein